MGFLPFNLMLLQLVAPTANMTKKEYKDAYGIDLDDVNIKAFKLVLFGGEKYAIDQIKEVDDGIEIYFNGRIMSITDVVQVSDEVYDVANAKPIYIHPIALYKGAEFPKYTLTMLIFNNSPDAIDTIAKLESAIGVIYSIVGGNTRIMINGGYINAGENEMMVTSYLQKQETQYALNGVFPADKTISAVSNAQLYAIFGTPDVMYDGVNKIN